MGLCFAPLVLIGYALTIEREPYRTSNVNGSVIEVQSCETGIGMDVKASTAGLFGVGIQYGFTKKINEYSITALPKVGLSYTSETRRELPMVGQFEVGAQVLLGYKQMRVGVEYWHLSNAGMKYPNIGLDMIVLQTGIVF